MKLTKSGSVLLILLIFFFFSSCQKEFSLEMESFAKGSLTDSLGNCLSHNVYGTYYNGVEPGGDTAFVEMQVEIKTPGIYKIQSDLQNGVQFADSGYFNSTGITTVKLKSRGTFTSAGTTAFVVNFDSSVCGFEIDVKDSTGLGLGGGDINTDDDNHIAAGTWEFSTDKGGYFHGNIDTAFIAKDTSVWASGGKMLVLIGFTSVTTDSALTLITYLPDNVISPGSYSTQAGPPDLAAIFGFNFTSTGQPIYDAVPDEQSKSKIIINITSYNSATKVVSGTFAGPANDGIAESRPIINIEKGSFSATVTP